MLSIAAAPPTSSSVAPTARAPSSPRNGICEQEFAKKKRRRHPAAAAPPRRLNHIARVGLLTELGGSAPASHARRFGAKKVNAGLSARVGGGNGFA